MKKPEKAGKKQGGATKWKKGQSGNLAGKPKGTRHKATQLAETLLDGQAKDLVQKCVDMALEGDGTAMKVCMDRLLPAKKDRPVSLSIPQIESMGDAASAMKAITNAVSQGDITPSEAQVLSAMIENYRKIVETAELEKRIDDLEKIAGAKK